MELNFGTNGPTEPSRNLYWNPSEVAEALGLRKEKHPDVDSANRLMATRRLKVLANDVGPLGKATQVTTEDNVRNFVASNGTKDLTVPSETMKPIYSASARVSNQLASLAVAAFSEKEIVRRLTAASSTGRAEDINSLTIRLDQAPAPFLDFHREVAQRADGLSHGALFVADALVRSAELVIRREFGIANPIESLYRSSEAFDLIVGKSLLDFSTQLVRGRSEPASVVVRTDRNKNGPVETLTPIKKIVTVAFELPVLKAFDRAQIEQGLQRAFGHKGLKLSAVEQNAVSIKALTPDSAQSLPGFASQIVIQ